MSWLSRHFIGKSESSDISAIDTRTSVVSRIVSERFGDNIGLLLGIFTTSPTGEKTKFLHPSGSAPEWSPDGEWIAFYESGSLGSFSNIFLIRLDGTGLSQVTYHEYCSAACPKWSWDSHYIAYCTTKDGKHQIWVVEVSSRRSTQITTEGSNGYPVWTPSNEIVYIKEDIDPSRLFIMQSDGTNPRPCLFFEPGDNEPVWSRDGKNILFIRNGKIGTMNSDGTDFRIIDVRGRGAVEAYWSPDCTEIVYSIWKRENAGFELFVIDIYGEKERRIIDNPIIKEGKSVNCQDVCWSPWLRQ